MASWICLEPVRVILMFSVSHNNFLSVKFSPINKSRIKGFTLLEVMVTNGLLPKLPKAVR